MAIYPVWTPDLYLDDTDDCIFGRYMGNRRCHDCGICAGQVDGAGYSVVYILFVDERAATCGVWKNVSISGFTL